MAVFGGSLFLGEGIRATNLSWSFGRGSLHLPCLPDSHSLVAQGVLVGDME